MYVVFLAGFFGDLLASLHHLSYDFGVFLAPGRYRALRRFFSPAVAVGLVVGCWVRFVVSAIRLRRHFGGFPAPFLVSPRVVFPSSACSWPGSS